MNTIARSITAIAAAAALAAGTAVPAHADDDTDFRSRMASAAPQPDARIRMASDDPDARIRMATQPVAPQRVTGASTLTPCAVLNSRVLGGVDYSRVPMKGALLPSRRNRRYGEVAV